jgi:seryl-tRNA synthetase
MTTTAREDQLTDAPESVRQPYDTGSILRRNVADLELALKQQTERAEAAEAELLAVREDNHSMMLEIDGLRTERDRLAAELAKLAKQKPALYMAFSDCGNFIRYWTRDTKNLEATMAVNDFEVLGFYAAPVPAPAVPAGYVAHLAQLADDPCQCHCCRTKQRKARALLQSAEVTK